MKIKVKTTKDYYQITIPVSEVHGNPLVRRMLDFYRIEEIASHSKATDEQIKSLAEEVDRSFWQANKKRLLGETDS